MSRVNQMSVDRCVPVTRVYFREKKGNVAAGFRLPPSAFTRFDENARLEHPDRVKFKPNEAGAPPPRPFSTSRAMVLFPPRRLLQISHVEKTSWEPGEETCTLKATESRQH